MTRLTGEHSSMPHPSDHYSDDAIRYYLSKSSTAELSSQSKHTSAVPNEPLHELTQEARTRYTSKRAVTGITAVALLSVLAPLGQAVPASAQETADLQPDTTNSALPSDTERVIAATTTTTPSEATQAKISIAAPPEAAQKSPATVSAAIATPETVTEPSKSTASKITIAAPLPESTTSTLESVAPVITASPSETLPVAPIVIAPEVTPEIPKENIAPVATPRPIEPVTPLQPVNISAPDASQKEVSHEPITPVQPATPHNSPLPEIDKTTASPEEIKKYDALKEIFRAIRSDGNINRAASLMLENFIETKKTATKYDKNKEPVIPVTNADLVTNVQELIKNFGGHADAEYTNAGRITLAMLLATAKDQDVMGSQGGKAIISMVKHPEDPYQAKLFDQYTAKAKELLEANDGILLKGINDDQRSSYIATYGYALLATQSDEAQQGEIQAMKDAEAKAAADEAARKQAEMQQSANGSAEAQAIQNLIDREGDQPSKRTFMVMQYLMQKTDLTLPQIGGILGNMLVESASTMDPSIHQFNGGPGRGIVQWEAGRLKNLIAFAAERGTTWDDFYTQLDFLLYELPGRQNTLEVIKSKQTQYEAARAFMILFETPYTVVKAYKTNNWSYVDSEAADRSSRADKFVAAFSNEVNAVNTARAEAAKKAAEEQEKYGPSFEQAVTIASDYFNNRDQYLKGNVSFEDRSQCSTFVSYFTQRYVSKSTLRRNGSVTTKVFTDNPDNNYVMKQASDITPFSIFSLSGGGEGYGHTGIISSVEPDGSVIIIESNVKATIATASGMLNFKSFGDKTVENNEFGQVNIEHWSSLDAWKQHWETWGYTSPSFASPKDLQAISNNFQKGSR